MTLLEQANALNEELAKEFTFGELTKIAMLPVIQKHMDAFAREQNSPSPE